MIKTVLIMVLTMTILLAAAASKPARANENEGVSNDAIRTKTPGESSRLPATAEALVADLYKKHDAGKSPFFQTKNRALVDKYFLKTLADLIWKDANNSSGEVGAIDGDPLYDSQDMEIKEFAIGKASAKGAQRQCWSVLQTLVKRKR